MIRKYGTVNNADTFAITSRKIKRQALGSSTHCRKYTMTSMHGRKRGLISLKRACVVIVI